MHAQLYVLSQQRDIFFFGFFFFRCNVRFLNNGRLCFIISCHGIYVYKKTKVNSLPSIITRCRIQKAIFYNSVWNWRATRLLIYIYIYIIQIYNLVKKKKKSKTYNTNIIFNKYWRAIIFEPTIFITVTHVLSALKTFLFLFSRIAVERPYNIIRLDWKKIKTHAHTINMNIIFFFRRLSRAVDIKTAV